MCGSGIFYAKSLLPVTVHKTFLKYCKHPLTIIFNNEVLKNNGFYLNQIQNSTNYDWPVYQNKVYMWWAFSLIREVGNCEDTWDTLHFNPLEFTMDMVLPNDKLVNTNDYVISNEIQDYNGIQTEKWNLNIRKNTSILLSLSLGVS